MEPRQLGGNLARMVTRAAPLLVALLVLLVDDDESEVGKRAEERRTRAHHHTGGTGAHHVPLIQALSRREARVEHRDRVAET